MPELPDLEVFSENLSKKFKNKTLKQLTIHKDKKINAPKEAFQQSFIGNTLHSIKRQGKEIHFTFDNDQVLGLHLMLKGELHYLPGTKEIKSKIIDLIFEDGQGLTLSDFMAQAMPILNPPTSEVPDALSDDFNTEYVKKKFEKNKGSVKANLLDQKFVRGIGNAYADEILYESNVSPFSICAQIPAEAVDALVSSTKSVLNDAIDSIKGVNPEGITGEVRSFLKVHVSGKTQTDKGEPIQFKEISGKKTYYTNSQVTY
jgi:formamidopyrimidine-DNA glycosylase